MIGDFGFATAAQGKNGDGKLLTRLGTPGYMAPEVLSGLGYDGKRTDMFSVGVALFLLAGRRFPFIGNAEPTDPLYKLIMDN